MAVIAGIGLAQHFVTEMQDRRNAFGYSYFSH
jgi:hypothetical protein